ncbi:MAG: LLM class flavin-dependent oxidoreductase [Actinobacteria bacterium]|nr:LLM class flavin-dependent oxidoreductase [Actinomycetota bacterium]
MTSPARGVTLASLMTMGPARWSSAAESAARLGYGSIWVAETTGPEAFASLGALAPLAPGLGLGTGVLALQLRTPMLAAMGAATLQALHPERDVLLGIGISSPAVVDRWHGATYGTRPLAQVREYLTLVRQCWGGEPVDFDGDYYHCRRFRLGIRLGERRPRLVLGALNARMLAVAGELADGVLLNYLPASGVPWCVEQVRAAEAAAGRKPGACPVYAYVHVGVTDLDSAGRGAGRPVQLRRRRLLCGGVPAYRVRRRGRRDPQRTRGKGPRYRAGRGERPDDPVDRHRRVGRRGVGRGHGLRGRRRRSRRRHAAAVGHRPGPRHRRHPRGRGAGGLTWTWPRT